MRRPHWSAEPLDIPAVEIFPNYEGMSLTELTKAMQELELEVALDDEVRLAQATKALARMLVRKEIGTSDLQDSPRNG